MATFLSSRVKNLNVGVSGYTENTDVLNAIGNITSSGSLKSTVASGTAPIQVDSTTLVDNLNADLLDGQDGSYYLDLENATGVFEIGDIIYASSTTNVSKLNIGNAGNLLTVVDGIPSWEEITAEDLGGISGINVFDDDKTPTFIGEVTQFNFGEGLFAELDLVDPTLAVISLDVSSISPEDIGAISGISIYEEGIFVGEVQNIDFIGGNITATVDVEGTASITLTDDPTFNTVRVVVADGTAPFTVTSTTLVNKLNADLLDGNQGSFYTNASNLSSGTVPVSRLSGSYNIDISGTATTATNSNFINVTTRNDSIIYKVLFTDSSSGNLSVYIDEDANQLTYNPDLGRLRTPVFVSSASEGTPPLEVASTTLVDNLNADLLDNEEGSYYLDLDNATNVLDETKGGTGISTYARGDIIYASEVDTLARLPLGSDNNVLYIDGSDIVWKALTPEDVGAIDGVILEDDGTNRGKVSTLSFNTNLVATIRLVNTDVGEISLADDISLNSVTTTSDSTINQQTIGKGGGNVATNTVLGYEGLLSNTGGDNNVAIGYQSQYLNENGNYNVAVGVQSLFNNEANNNTAFGHNTLFNNQTGNYNTSIGSFTGISTIASRNILIGSGTNSTNLFDVPNTNQDFQLAIGHNISGTSNYWIVGDENYNIGLGVTNPEEKLDVGGNVIIRGDLDVGTTGNPSILDLTGSAFISEKISINTTTDDAQLNVAGDVFISANSSSDLLRLNQTGTGNVFVVEDDLNPDATPFIIDSDGNVGIKTSDPQYTLDIGGDAKLNSKLYDSNDSSGNTDDLLVSTGSNVEWKSPENITIGNASNINIIGKNDDFSYSVVFTSSSTGYQGVYIDDDALDLIYNPNTGKLSSKIFVSTIADGTAPLEVVSTTLVNNLNADLLDNEEGSYYLDLDNATNVLVETKGGTGLSSYTSGDIIYASAENTLSKLSIGASATVLTTNDSGFPEWKSLDAGDVGAITGIILQNDGSLVGNVATINFDPNIYAELDLIDSAIANVFLSKTPSFDTVTLNIADGTAPLIITSTTLVDNLNADLLDDEEGSYYLDLNNATNVLDETKGGTGLSSYTTGDIIYASAENTLSKLSIGSNKSVLSIEDGEIIWKLSAGINVYEEDSLLGNVENINFVSQNITATIDPVDTITANITLTDDPTFNTTQITNNLSIGTEIDIIPIDTLNNGTIKFEGSQGTLFSISNNLTSGSIFSVNDISGIPSIDVNANGTILLAPFGLTEYIGIGKTNPTEKLDLSGNLKVTGDIFVYDGKIYPNFGIDTEVGKNLELSTEGTTAIIIDDNQNVLIGTTSNINDSKLVVNGSISETVSGIQYPVVSQFDIGTEANQIPLNQFLGDMAFANFPFAQVLNNNNGAEATVTINSQETDLYSHIASYSTDVTYQISNLKTGHEIKMYIRNTNASARTITIQASETDSGYTNVNLASGSGTPGSASTSTVILNATSGTSIIWVANIGGDIVGGILA